MIPGDIIIGFALGVIALGVVTIILMRSKMIITHVSRYDFENTIAKVESAIRSAGWSLVESKRLNESLRKNGVDFSPQVHLIKLCKAEYAAEVLKDYRHMASLMPCTIAIYETDDGRVMLSKMNTGLMGKVFGGAVARVMGGYVAADETRMLKQIYA